MFFFPFVVASLPPLARLHAAAALAQLVAVNQEEVASKEDVTRIVSSSSGNTITLTVVRDNTVDLSLMTS